MSAVFITAMLAVKEGHTLDWTCIDSSVEAYKNNEVIEIGKENGWYDNEAAEGYAEPHPLHDPDGDDMAERMRSLARDLFHELGDLFDGTSGNASEVSMHTVPGWTMYVTGGFTHGDAPSDAYEQFSNAMYFPQVLRQIGFHTGDE